MPPFVKKRFCRFFDGADYFKPRGISLGDLQVNNLALDELEAVHLCDFEELMQEAAAGKMGISTSTLQRLLYSGRKKIIDAIYNSKALRIFKHDDVAEYIDQGVKQTTIKTKSRRKGCNRNSIVSKRG